ncbi:hypothetical protein C8Q75DRAFT_596266 [Abortiporus biennis]|nr:hypothetical protein C8Q75DRAFT_596266 [Abortiporus biennis]
MSSVASSTACKPKGNVCRNRSPGPANHTQLLPPYPNYQANAAITKPSRAVFATPSSHRDDVFLCEGIAGKFTFSISPPPSPGLPRLSLNDIPNPWESSIQSHTSSHISLSDLGEREIAHPIGEVAPPSTDNASTVNHEQEQDISVVRVIVKPVSVEQVSKWRYTQFQLEGFIQNNSKDFVHYIEPMTLEFRDPIDDNWKIHEHDEGKQSFCTVRNNRTVSTHANLADPVVLEIINTALSILEGRIPRDAPEDTEIVIELEPNTNIADSVQTCHYYLASWKNKAVFWIERVPVNLLSDDYVHIYQYNKGLLDQAKQCMFWKHIEMFPHDRTLCEESVKQAADLSLFCRFDALTSEMSTVPYNPEKIRDISQVLHSIKPGKQDGKTAAILGRANGWFYWDRFVNHHGQLRARLNRDECIGEKIESVPSTAFAILSCICFWWPDEYLAALNSIWCDQRVQVRPWNSFFNRLKKDWKYCTIPTTVLLGANMGFLAIESIDDALSPAKVASYISIALGLTNFLVSQILSRYHQSHSMLESAERPREFLSRTEDKWGGLKLLAFVLSLPNVTFMYSMLSFLFAMLYVNFHRTTMPVQVVMAIILAFLAVLVLVVFYTYQEKHLFYSTTSRNHSGLFKSLWDSWRKKSDNGVKRSRWSWSWPNQSGHIQDEHRLVEGILPA